MHRNSIRRFALPDGLGMLLSGLCIAHCLVLPVVAATAPVLAGGENHFHLLMLALVIPVSVWALADGCQRHRRGGVFAAGMLGICLLAFGATVGHNYFGLTVDRVFTVSGALVLAASHLANAFYCRRPRRAAFSG